MNMQFHACHVKVRYEDMVSPYEIVEEAFILEKEVARKMEENGIPTTLAHCSATALGGRLISSRNPPKSLPTSGEMIFTIYTRESGSLLALSIISTSVLMSVVRSNLSSTCFEVGPFTLFGEISSLSRS